MNHTSTMPQKLSSIMPPRVPLAFLAVLLCASLAPADDIPFPAALDHAAIEVDRLAGDVALFQTNFTDSCDLDADGTPVLGPTVSPEHWGWTQDFARNRNLIYIMGVSRARLSMQGTDEWLRDEIKARLRPNQTITLNRLGSNLNNFGHYTEQFAASMAIGELLLQSVGDIIRTFPAWPQGRNAAFTQLRTQGGFLVSAEQDDHRVVKVEIQTCSFACSSVI